VTAGANCQCVKCAVAKQKMRVGNLFYVFFISKFYFHYVAVFLGLLVITADNKARARIVQ